MQNAETAVAASRRWREGKPISTSRAESLVNTLFNARMNKRRQMRWSARGAHRALQVRAAVQDNRFHTAITTIAAWCPRFLPLSRKPVEEPRHGHPVARHMMIAAPTKTKNPAREQAMETIVGTGKYTYKVHEDWAHVPVGVDMKPAAVAVDPHDRVYCFNRSPDHPVVVVVVDRSGEFLFSWGAGIFRFPHAIRFDAEGFAWLTDEHHWVYPDL
jgi:hypothetical protein